MKKLIFVFAVLFSTSLISCNKQVESKQDSIVIDSDSINVDSITDSTFVCED